MKTKIMTGFLIASIVTGATIPINTLATPIVQAETQQENMDISSSLRKLGAQSKLIQTYIDQSLMSPNVQLEEVPALNTNQFLIKQDMKEWSSELYPQLILLNSKSKGFVTKFNSYYPTLKSFVDNKEDREGFSDRLEVLQEMAMTNQENAQRQINELTDLKLQLDKKLKDFDTNVATAQGILGTDGTGKIDQLKNEILNTKKAIQNDLQQIALIPGALNEQGFAIFKEVYSLSKEIIEPAAQAGVAAYNKGKEINNSILEAEKKAVQEATEQGKTALEIESAKKAAREAIEKSKQGEIAAAAAAKTQEYDLMKVIDTEKIKKTFGVFAEVNKLTAEQRAYLDDLEKQNQKIYDLTTKLSIADLQKSMLLLTQNDLYTFANQVDVELDLLKRYKEDLNLIKNSITKLSTNVDTTNEQSQKDTLRQLKNVISYLEEQVYKF
ncbi:hemolytic enterotoxin HBL lytic component L2 [Bacillus thuringiensis]|uniref:Hemolytic enterotoxin HBL lytic component L2 n=1 Tax=Bacillus thuringiensis serovar toumanoffi TaxID=180862 RepID=A0ABD5I204_BACTU|nr:hemolytic enterotoxin HBL lytic component L2 [Bacillus thuringiensis]MCR6781092.1 hemolytic enterotoxin HBL lytic component L2 [Bacillus thuringiensis]MCR6859162.1 hemolytic enterotoxin HBL lytic component L2 [Bacillus thuringiensis]MCR6865620.1 hemolytic enterotoxin HBL lytic component L2 [Bacillus thuringiensis]MDW9211183.1 hemolytic enterotoxin HBL lytic component L2 [Bacillus thuringiensis serovar toumanoffi]MED2622535.1 hemolytic enterotoxin HBL lytic component L2 [Bacillus thuringiens